MAPKRLKSSEITVSTTQVRSGGGAQARRTRTPARSGNGEESWIDSKYDQADAQKAHERAARGHIRGKIVLEVK